MEVLGTVYVHCLQVIMCLGINSLTSYWKISSFKLTA